MTHDMAVPRGLRAAGIGTAIGAIHHVDGRENGHERQQADQDDSSHGRKDEIYRRHAYSGVFSNQRSIFSVEWSAIAHRRRRAAEPDVCIAIGSLPQHQSGCC
jgi:hypothetical protein